MSAVDHSTHYAGCLKKMSAVDHSTSHVYEYWRVGSHLFFSSSMVEDCFLSTTST
jgi:hypothetical protein